MKPESDYNLIDWWKKVFLKNYANFSGRARRAEYWYYTLGNVLLLIPFYLFMAMSSVGDEQTLPIFSLGIYLLICLASIIPSLAVTVRRLHDLNKSGWYYFIVLIPLIGSIILLIWLFTDGNRFPNNYGADPKNMDDVEFDFEKTEIA